MSIVAGTRVGVYEVVALIGAGGMGKVYRARDTRLGRDVALKVLPEAFARDGQRMARFEREARLLASLNHPNIAAIYGIEDAGGIRALVMELVEGPTLAERIAAGPVAVDEALAIARQVAEAVEYAHDQNVIHRDLKPANIKVKEDGTVKVLDFGLAKAMSDEPAETDMSNSPTLSMAATRQGVILGTAAYMSPEQAKGKRVDRRTDVWAFGVSTGGGLYVNWRSDGKELYYLAPDGKLMAVPVSTNGGSFEPGTPTVLFQTRVMGSGGDMNLGSLYDVSRDGRFLVNTVLEDAATPITLLQNWAPGGRQ